MRGWPASLVEIAEIVGVAPTLMLVQAYGGVGCYVPHAIEATHPIAQAIGPDAAHKLAQAFGGSKLDVPVLAVARQKKSQIAQATGKTSDVARLFGVTARWVRMIRNSGAPDPRQIDMFGDRKSDGG
jgi:hypothetical protein